MAWIKKIRGKKGISYQIKVSEGSDSRGRQIVHTKTWRPDPAMTEKQQQKALAAAADEFERMILQGYQVDDRQTFHEYALYVIRTKAQAGLKRRTVERYSDLLVRVDQAIGHKKLTEVRPAHLNLFYENLAEEGVRVDNIRYTLKMDLAGWMIQGKISKAELSRKAHVAPSTIQKVLEGAQVTPRTAEQVAAAVDIPMGDLFEDRVDVTPLAAKTVLEYHRFISSVFSMAVKEMLVPYNPASRATPPKLKKKTPAYYQPDQVDAVLDALEEGSVSPMWKAFTYLLIDTGARRGEIAGLRWPDIDLDLAIVMFDHALLYTAKSGTYEDSTKTERERALRLAPETIEILKLWKAEQERIKKALGNRWMDSEFVFTRQFGGAINPDSATKWLDGFSKKHDLPHLHPHAFRHTAASTLIADGVDLVTTAGELGHANATVTASIYAHQIALARAKASESRSSVFRHRRESAAKSEE